MGQLRRAFTREFKREAVKLATESGHPTAQVAPALGLTPNLLRRWKQEVTGDPGAAFPGKVRRRANRWANTGVARLMAGGYHPRQDGQEWRATTDSAHLHPVAPNTLNRQFAVATPNQVWAGDLTYVWTAEGWLYLAVVLDLYSRRVIAWGMGSRLTQDLATAALTMALERRRPPAGVLRITPTAGSQYAATEYRERLSRHGLTASMSRRANGWDNAVVESFFHTLKTELVHLRCDRTREEDQREIFEWIEVFYNRVRRHSTLGYRSPAECETTATQS